MKQRFLLSEVWYLTAAAAFQRANVYIKAISDEEKKTFKKGLRKHLEQLVGQYYQNPTVLDEQHIQNIQSITTYSKQFGQILQGEQLYFGICQKLLNLYLKYLWCLGIIPAPPHFPIDRRIQTSLKLSAIVSWTKHLDETTYRRIIELAKARKPPQHSDIASWELTEFARSQE